MTQLEKAHVYAPTNHFPVRARPPEFQWLRRFVRMRGDDAHGLDEGIGEGKHNVAWRDPAHEIVEGIPTSVGLAFGRPKNEEQ